MDTTHTNYRDVTFGEMVALARHWTGPARATIEAIPAAAAVLPDLEDFLKAVATIEKALPENELKALDALLMDLDADHDDLVGGMFDFLTALARLSHDPGVAAQIITLRDHLFPGGKAMMLESYLTEAGAAEGVQSRLTDDDRGLSTRIPLLEVPTFAVEIDNYQAKGVALREGETKRAALRKAVAENAGPSGAEVLAQRRFWGKSARFLREAIDVTRGVTPEQRREVLAKLDEAQESAADRALKRRQATPPTTPT